MLRINVTKRLKKEFDRIEDFSKRFHEIYFDGLYSIFHTLKYFEVPNKEQYLNKLDSYYLKENELKKYSDEITKRYYRVNKVMSIGDYWNDDEWVLILLYRLDCEMAKDFCQYKAHPFPNLNLRDLCEDMKHLAQTKKNQKVFEFSLSQMQKNSPLPFIDIWFEVDDHQYPTYL